MIQHKNNAFILRQSEILSSGSAKGHHGLFKGHSTGLIRPQRGERLLYMQRTTRSWPFNSIRCIHNSLIVTHFSFLDAGLMMSALPCPSPSTLFQDKWSIKEICCLGHKRLNLFLPLTLLISLSNKLSFSNLPWLHKILKWWSSFIGNLEPQTVLSCG